MVDWGKFFTKKRIIFLVLFVILVFLGKKINFSPLVGAESQFFTLFQFFGPIAGGFLGATVGWIAVLFAQIVDFFIVGKELTIVNLLRLLPMLFAAFFFASWRKYSSRYVNVFVPLLAIILFVVHPVGRQVWFFSLYWLIPVIAVLLPKKWPGKLFFRSCGATFMAHAVGGVLWIYTVPMPAEAWIGLIPIVAYERFLFGLGIAGSYVVFNSLLDYVVEKWKLNVPSKVLSLDKRYTISSLLSFKKQAN